MNRLVNARDVPQSLERAGAPCPGWLGEHLSYLGEVVGERLGQAALLFGGAVRRGGAVDQFVVLRGRGRIEHILRAANRIGALIVAYVVVQVDEEALALC